MSDTRSDPRYRSMAKLAAAAGAMAALVPIAVVVSDVGLAHAVVSWQFWTGTGLLLAAGVLVPYWAVRAIGRCLG